MKKYILLINVLFLFACSSDQDSVGVNEQSNDGQGGSLATFALKGEYLYTVDENDLNVFSIIDPKNPTLVNTVFIGFNIETLFGYKDYLYIGSQNGMFIYGVSNPEFPEKLSSVEHFTACDPVVANETHAYVTLHSNSFCGNNINTLEVYDVTTVTKPILINTRNLSAPKGLGLYHNYLIVCDDEIKIFNISDPQNSTLVTTIDKKAFDVIISNDLLISIGSEGLHQYKLNSNNIESIEYYSSIQF